MVPPSTRPARWKESKRKMAALLSLEKVLPDPCSSTLPKVSHESPCMTQLLFKLLPLLELRASTLAHVPFLSGVLASSSPLALLEVSLCWFSKPDVVRAHLPGVGPLGGGA